MTEEENDPLAESQDPSCDAGRPPGSSPCPASAPSESVPRSQMGHSQFSAWGRGRNVTLCGTEFGLPQRGVWPVLAPGQFPSDAHSDHTTSCMLTRRLMADPKIA